MCRLGISGAGMQKKRSESHGSRRALQSIAGRLFYSGEEEKSSQRHWANGRLIGITRLISCVWLGPQGHVARKIFRAFSHTYAKGCNVVSGFPGFHFEPSPQLSLLFLPWLVTTTPGAKAMLQQTAMLNRTMDLVPNGSKTSPETD